VTPVRWTVAGMALVFLSVIAWDIRLAFDGVPGNTISGVVMGEALQHPWVALVVVFALGVLCGHFFWPQDKEARW